MQDSIDAIVEIFKDYAAVQFSVDHVVKWASQFEETTRPIILKEIVHIFSEHYYSRAFFVNLFTEPKSLEEITGHDPESFWRSASLLSLQESGKSQTEMVEILSNSLKAQFNIDVSINNLSANQFLYIDDYLFSGLTLKNDMCDWIKNSAPHDAVVHIAHFEAAEGAYRVEEELVRECEKSGKNIQLKFSEIFVIENRLSRSGASDILWPLGSTTNEAARRVMDRIGARVRLTEGQSKIFSSNQSRRVLEEQFLIAGERILSNYRERNFQHLGFHIYPGFGFGALTATYRKCPNNCPLALWWGTYGGDPGSLNVWYPLLPRSPMASFRQRARRTSIFSRRS